MAKPYVCVLALQKTRGCEIMIGNCTNLNEVGESHVESLVEKQKESFCRPLQEWWIGIDNTVDVLRMMLDW